MRRRLLCLALCTAITPLISSWSASGAPDDLPPPAGWSGSGDERVCRVFVPSANRRHGEVRLVRRGGAVGVQTLLYTPTLRRGLRKIRQQEMAHWPAHRTGHADSQTYLDVLDKGKTGALEAFDRRANPADARQNLLIEVVQQGSRAWVGAALPEFAGADESVEIRDARSVARSPVSTHHARAAMEIILQSAFHRPGRTLDEFLSGEATRSDPRSDEQLQQPVGR